MTIAGYYPDLKAFSLTKFKKLLTTSRLLPSQQILQEHLDERFACLAQQGITNLAQLQTALKTKAAAQALAKATGLSVDYLTVLRREVNSYQPQPIDLKEFPGVKPVVVRRLQQIGIKTTAQLFSHVLTRKDRRAFAQQNQIEDDDLLELTRLTDVARAKWVGPKFARLLIESDYDTMEKIAQANVEEFHASLVHVNADRGIYQGKFGIEDLRSWIDGPVQLVPLVIQY
jgi:hypothetical protein